MKKASLILLMLLCFQLSQASLIFKDNEQRQEVLQTFNERMKQIGPKFFDIKGLKLTDDELDALHFLYAYMPVADVTDYPTRFYLENIRSTFTTQQAMPWGTKVPQLLFRHFVMPLRVNNENLDDARKVFYGMLKDRIQGMSMQEAILKVNHWCHEHVTYTPSDARTLSPLACMKNAQGRCGEESTFTVAALRAVGIPARQVYTPRWAHTDDNHAWVEAWADGKWYFLGACEPEPVLNLGWFNAPASRAMLMHTRVFGHYDGPEEIVLRTSNFTEINLIDHYAETARVDFTVVDQNDKPVNHAQVDFKIYNYAEFYTAVRKFTDKQGKTFLTAGKGDLLVWASKDGYYGFSKASFGQDQQVAIRLNRTQKTDLARKIYPLDSLDIVPPPEKARIPQVTEEMNAKNKLRFAQEDSIRKAYESTFYHAADESELSQLLVKARGNWRVIKNFYDKYPEKEERALSLLKTLNDKDLRDITMDILEDHLLAKSNQLSPRVENEMIILPFKQQLQNAFDAATTKKFLQNPALLVEWIQKNIRINPDNEALRIAQTPIGVWKSRFTDARSRDIFFVDLARSIGIEARKDVVTSKVQYRQNGQWMDVNFETEKQKTAPKGKLVLSYSPSKYLDDPKYYNHFSISKIENGIPVLLNFDEGQVDMGGGTSWKNTFKDGTSLDAGTYFLVTGTRMASGNVKESHQIFNIVEGQTTTLDLTLRTSKTEISVIGNFDSESKFVKDGQEVSILSQTGRGYFVLGLIGVGQEPTNHTLRDIAKLKEKFDRLGRPFVLLFESEAEAKKFKSSDFGVLPNKTIFGVNKDGAIKKQIVAQMKLQDARQLPIFIIADTFNRVVFLSQGYTIGLGEQLYNTLSKL